MLINRDGSLSKPTRSRPRILRNSKMRPPCAPEASNEPPDFVEAFASLASWATWHLSTVMLKMPQESLFAAFPGVPSIGICLVVDLATIEEPGVSL